MLLPYFCHSILIVILSVYVLVLKSYHIITHEAIEIIYRVHYYQIPRTFDINLQCVQASVVMLTYTMYMYDIKKRTRKIPNIFLHFYF